MELEHLKIEYGFIEKWAKNARAEHLRIYLYLLCRYKKLGTMLSVKEIADELNTAEKSVQSAFDFWTAVGVLTENGGKHAFTHSATAVKENSLPAPSDNGLSERPNYHTKDIHEAIGRDKSLNFLYKHAQILFGKTLSNLDIEILYSFYDYYGLSVEVIAMLLGYATGKEKRNMRYIEKVAIDWADKGITTTDDAEGYIKKMELRDSKENKIRSILGITDRRPTESESKYIRTWVEELKISLELISPAYERTVSSTGKLSMAYMDKILRNWHQNGIKTALQIEHYDAEYKSKYNEKPDLSHVKKSKFNNFSTGSGVDYAEIARKKIRETMG